MKRQIDSSSRGVYVRLMKKHEYAKQPTSRSQNVVNDTNEYRCRFSNKTVAVMPNAERSDIAMGNSGDRIAGSDEVNARFGERGNKSGIHSAT